MSIHCEIFAASSCFLQHQTHSTINKASSKIRISFIWQTALQQLLQLSTYCLSTSIKDAKIRWPSTRIGGPARCDLKPALRSNRSMPSGETVIKRFAPYFAAQSMAAWSQSIAISDDICRNGDLLGAPKSTAAKRESSQISGEFGGTAPFNNCGKTSERR